MRNNSWTGRTVQGFIAKGDHRSKEDEVMKLSSSIFVTNFPENFSAKELWTICNQYESVVDAFIPDKRSKSGKRFGFVRLIKIFDIDRLVDNLCTIWVGRFKLHANIARTESLPINMKKDLPAIVLDESCINQLEYSTNLMGKVKEFTSITNLKAVLANEVVWVDTKGIPLKGWSKNMFSRISSKWGELLYFDDQEEGYLHTKRICIKTKLAENIYKSFKIIIRGKIFWIRAKEVSGWIPKFEDDDDEDSQSDVEMSKNGSIDEDGGTFKFPNLENESDCEEVAETIFKKNQFSANMKEDYVGKKDIKNGDSIYDNNLKYPPGFTPANDDEAQNNPLKESNEEKDNYVLNDVPNSKDGKVESNVKKDFPFNSSKNDTGRSVCLGHFQKCEIPHHGGSILQLMDELIKVGQAMGYNMEGCTKNISDIIDSQGVNDGEWLLNGKKILIVSIYAPQELCEKKMLWDYLILVLNNWNGEVVIMGDFNEVRMQEERYRSIFNIQGADAFNLFISFAGLEEFDLDGFDNFVEQTWKNAQVTDMNAMSKLMKKLKFLKEQIRMWIKANKDMSKNNKQDLKADLNKIDLMLDKGDGNSDILSKRMDVIKSLQELDKLDTMEMAQKTKIKWAIEGDENSKYYHGILNKRRNQLAIRGILVEGIWIEDPLSVKGEFFSHFANHFDKPPSYRLHVDMDFPNKLTIEQQSDLETNITREEIKKAVWDCEVDKSPGPDGFTFGFYRRYWSFMENDVVEAVLHFFHFEKFPKGSNSSFIALIPKIHDAKMVKDYRPITLIGSLYKIISKVLANRMVVILGDIVNDVQSAFVANQKILDGPFILNELFQWCKNKKYQIIIFKVDFEKAYDSVRWDYLEDILKFFGFGEKWCGWIRNCLLSSKGSVIVNGSPTNKFQFQKGLKQGDPLSPFLFILIMETLHISMQRVVDAGMFKGIKLGNSLQMCHLFYADDAIFMGHWSDSNLDTILLVLDCFYHASGLHINMIKSKLMGISVPSAKVDEAANKIRCATLKVPFSYLGSKVGYLMSRTQSWNDIVNTILTRLSRWKLKTLSIGGRLTVLKYVLEYNGNKQIWVKWSKVLASKENGYGIFVLNNLLSGPRSFKGYMVSIVNWVNMSKTITLPYGNGEDTLFWEDAWRDDNTFKSIYPRLYALETNKNVTVASKLFQLDLATSFRRAPRGCGDFLVASIRKSIDNRFLPVVASKTRWIHEVPIKVNILAWKVRMDSLPTRLNISKRGLDIESILCPEFRGLPTWHLVFYGVGFDGMVMGLSWGCRGLGEWRRH
ncbi:RNA-directed DNA polymerase, eukaryota [Tanacetum coccineum]|uniref:RNA-directed DNA polymerase, eukaryota n=1 Tax=Tanacetum coccineum TaxID=301880 RepID=A0ABQ5F2F9_9ASTR